METVGVFNITISNNLILLAERNNLSLWDSFGGKFEEKEAIYDGPEAHEETGYNIRNTRIFSQIRIDPSN
ncbi:hypothetical protein [Enterococcus sp.]|uniref:hypothetical protein n=1 Tax=Enterococcus sp. TaxID=35783 RepID=UPI0025B96306|nr:hypothetical protein [Enterococcus sp.]